MAAADTPADRGTAPDAGTREVPFPVPEFEANPEKACSYNPPVAAIPGGGCLHTGISLRDHFAGRVVAGLVANSEAVHVGADPILSRLSLDTARAAASIAHDAYAIADAMLAERQRPIRPGARATAPTPSDAGRDHGERA